MRQKQSPGPTWGQEGAQPLCPASPPCPWAVLPVLPVLRPPPEPLLTALSWAFLGLAKDWAGVDTFSFTKQMALLLMQLQQRLSLLSKHAPSSAPEVQPPRPCARGWRSSVGGRGWLAAIILPTGSGFQV